jgi:hypothetical protein
MERATARLAGLLAALGLLSACAHEPPAPGIAGYGLYYSEPGPGVRLAYGRADSDDLALMLDCARGSGRVQISEASAATSVAALVLTSAGKHTLAPVRTEPLQSSDDLLATGWASADAPALAAFRATGRIEIVRGRSRYAIQATPAQRTGVEKFFVACGAR